MRMAPENGYDIVGPDGLEKSRSFLLGPPGFAPGIKAIMLKDDYRLAAASDIFFSNLLPGTPGYAWDSGHHR